MAGLVVEEFSKVAPDFSQVVVGEILTVEPHPNADRLHLCTVVLVQNNENCLWSINVRPHLKVPTALVGASCLELLLKKQLFEELSHRG